MGTYGKLQNYLLKYRCFTSAHRLQVLVRVRYQRVPYRKRKRFSSKLKSDPCSGRSQPHYVSAATWQLANRNILRRSTWSAPNNQAVPTAGPYTIPNVTPHKHHVSKNKVNDDAFLRLWQVPPATRAVSFKKERQQLSPIRCR